MLRVQSYKCLHGEPYPRMWIHSMNLVTGLRDRSLIMEKEGGGGGGLENGKIAGEKLFAPALKPG